MEKVTIDTLIEKLLKIKEIQKAQGNKENIHPTISMFQNIEIKVGNEVINKKIFFKTNIYEVSSCIGEDKGEVNIHGFINNN